MKKNLYLVIISIITILVIIFSTCFHIGNVVSKFFPFGVFWNDEDTSMSGDDIEVSESLDAFENIKVDASASDVRISYGDGFSWRYEGDSALKPDVKIDGNTLVVNENNDIRFHWGDWNTDCKTTITIPEGTKLDRITVDSSAGNLLMKDVAANRIDAELSAGNVNLKNITIDTAVFDLSAGNFNVDDSDITDLQFECSAGNAILKDITFEKLTADMSAGNLQIQSAVNLDVADIEADSTDLHIQDKRVHGGSFTQNGDSNISVEIDCSAGSASLEW